jgi:PTS system nitrogen regulatory IIA component
MDSKEILTTDETAEFLSLTPYTVREYAKKGLIPARKMGKSWRFYKPDLVAWVRGKEAPKEEGATL